jgi:hypothetical protein
MEQIYNPGICDISKAELTPYDNSNGRSFDITALITSVTISQSIYSPSISGSLSVIDNIGLLERIPLRGEETLDLKLKSYDIQTTREIKGIIYKIDNVVPIESGNGLSYTLHFLSKHTFDANINYFIKSFKNMEGSDIALNIFKKYYSSISESNDVNKEYLPEDSKKYKLKKDSNLDVQRYFYLQKTHGKISAIIPRLAPSEAIGFITERSFSDKDLSSAFRFFETYDGYYFVTDEWLLEKARGQNSIKSFDYVQYLNKDPADANVTVNTIESFSNPKRVDFSSEMIQGSYNNTVFEVDLLRHKANRKDFSYLGKDGLIGRFKTMTGASATSAIDIHSEKFIRDKFTTENAKRFMVIRDYTQKVSDSGLSRDNTFYTEMSAFRNMYTRHLNATKVTIGMRGRLDLNAGEVININVREFDSAGQPKRNRQLSGRYLIQTVLHNIDKGVISTVCQICKYDYSDTINDQNRVN